MMILKALSKQLFGAKYERVIRSFAACLILFLAVHTAGIRMEIAPSVLFLTAAAFTAGIMWQALCSAGNAERMAGLFMLPFASGEMTFSFVSAFAAYTLLTKTLPVLALFFAVWYYVKKKYKLNVDFLPNQWNLIPLFSVIMSSRSSNSVNISSRNS